MFQYMPDYGTALVKGVEPGTFTIDPKGGLSSELPPKSRTGVRRAWSVSSYEVHRMFRNTELLKIAALFNVRVAFSHVIACRTPTA